MVPARSAVNLVLIFSINIMQTKLSSLDPALFYIYIVVSLFKVNSGLKIVRMSSSGAAAFNFP